MVERKIVGLFSIDRSGNFCFHPTNQVNKEEAERVRKTLNKSVTGGPYKVMVAVAVALNGDEGKENDR